MADDDALHAERNRLLDLLALKGCVLLALEDVQITPRALACRATPAS
jgi:hypothetical protein